MADIFLSYNRDDQAAARRFAEAFERAGFSVWWDQTLNAGENYDQVTERALREASTDLVAAGAGIFFPRPLLDSRMEDYAIARRVIREQIAEKGFPEQGFWPVRVAQWVEFFDDRELGLRSVDALLVNNASFDSMADNFWRPVLSGLRREPSFRKLLQKLGLVEYWRTTGNWGDFCKPVGPEDFECH